jgi:hypothetical protein
MKIELNNFWKKIKFWFFNIDIFQYIDNILDQIFIEWNIFLVFFSFWRKIINYYLIKKNFGKDTYFREGKMNNMDEINEKYIWT